MQLTFDNLNELRNFIEWAGHVHLRDVAALQVQRDTANTGDVAFDTPPAGPTLITRAEGDELNAAAVASLAGGEALQPANTDGPVKRTQRTKAEIEAARKVLHDKAGLPSGTNPFEQQEHAADTEGPTTSDEGTAERLDTIVTPFQHLTRAREFIGKHGMPKYSESFTAAGLDPHVERYTAEQRIAHIAALDALEAG